MRRVALDYPARWRAILEAFADWDVDACIAGGAFRDLANRKPIKDIDLFFDERKVSAATILVPLGYERTHCSDIPESDIESIVSGVSNWFDPNDPTQPILQAISTINSGPDDYLEFVVGTFDFAISMIGAGTDGTVRATDECLADFERKEITILLDEGDRTNDRGLRIQSKYGWPVYDGDGQPRFPEL